MAMNRGPLALELARTLDPTRGTVILVPAMNYPAFRASTRISIGRGSMNRSFPSRPDGTVTEKIADYFHHRTAAARRSVFDFPSGGRTLGFLPYYAAHILPTGARRRAFAAVETFTAPYSDEDAEIDAVGMYGSR